MAINTILSGPTSSHSLLFPLLNPKPNYFSNSFSGISLKINPQSLSISSAAGKYKPLTVVAATEKPVAVLKGSSNVEGVVTPTQDDDDRDGYVQQQLSPIPTADPSISSVSMSNSSPRRSIYLGIDVGTGSARAGFFNESGKLLGSASSPTQIWKERGCVEQSSTDIWLAVCAAVKSARSLANVDANEVIGMGFAATCSLVAVDCDGEPVTVSLSGDARRNIIVWMDHRAVNQARRINASNSPVLQYCGGAVSPEMETPKLLWVKENLQESWSLAFRWMDLSDWLSYRATGDDTRSLCTTVCKWTYLGHAHMDVHEKDRRNMEACGWDDQFLEEIGLGDLTEGHHAKIGKSVAFPGHALGSGLKSDAAKELGLVAGIPVATSLIDAHAGGVGVLESVPASITDSYEKDADPMCHGIVLVCGTSTCHMAVSPSKLLIPGVWGPFWSAMVPEYWLTEGGQSVTGALLDFVIENHVASPHLADRAASKSVSLSTLLNEILESMMHELASPFLAALTSDIHVLPDFHGNRSPIADPKSKGMISGLRLDSSEKHLALLYFATLQGIAYGTRHIVEHCNAHGHKINTLLACGGLSKNQLYIQEQADIIGYPLVLPKESEAVLLGAAILGSVAAEKYASVSEAMKALSSAGQVVYPSKDPRVKKYHDAKYKIFRELYEQQLSHRAAMAEALS